MRRRLKALRCDRFVIEAGLVRAESWLHSNHDRQVLPSDFSPSPPYSRNLIKSVASPRNEKNPKTSVNVVIITLDAIAGSTREVFRAIGMRVPTMAATIMLQTSATARLRDSKSCPFQTWAVTAITKPL